MKAITIFKRTNKSIFRILNTQFVTNNSAKDNSDKGHTNKSEQKAALKDGVKLDDLKANANKPPSMSKGNTLNLNESFEKNNPNANNTTPLTGLGKAKTVPQGDEKNSNKGNKQGQEYGSIKGENTSNNTGKQAERRGESNATQTNRYGNESGAQSASPLGTVAGKVNVKPGDEKTRDASNVSTKGTAGSAPAGTSNSGEPSKDFYKSPSDANTHNKNTRI